jgi:hypothetical protein
LAAVLAAESVGLLEHAINADKRQDAMTEYRARERISSSGPPIVNAKTLAELIPQLQSVMDLIGGARISPLKP